MQPMLLHLMLMLELKNNHQVNGIQIKHFEHLIEEDKKNYNNQKQ
jgi:hypothetical protein